jgi:hypothetical protein
MEKDRTRKLLRFIGRYSPQMSQIAFVTNQHNNNIAVSMIAQFLQPAGNIFIGSVLAGVKFS